MTGWFTCTDRLCRTPLVAWLDLHIEYIGINTAIENFNDAPDLETAENIIKTYYDTYKAASKMFGSLSEAGLGEEAERWLEMKREIRAMVRRSLRGRS